MAENTLTVVPVPEFMEENVQRNPSESGTKKQNMV